MGGGVQDVVGGASDTGAGGEVEEGWGLAGAPVGGVLVGKCNGANAAVEGGIPDVIGGAPNTSLGNCVIVGRRSTSTSSRGCGNHASCAADASGSSGSSACGANAVKIGGVVEHACGTAGKVEESFVGERQRGGNGDEAKDREE